MAAIPQRWRRRLKAPGIFLAALFIATALLVWRVYAFGQIVSKSNADAVIVLGAAVSGGRPSPVYRERLEYGIQLLREHRVRWLILTGGRSEGATEADSEVARHYVIGRGVSDTRILSEAESHNTYQNLYYVREVGKLHGLRSYLVVSDPFHLRRAITMAQELGLQAEPAPTPTSRMNGFGFLLKETWLDAKHHLRRLYSQDGGEMGQTSH